jgi:hypothetical protein
MPINKLPGSTSPDPILYNASYDQHAVARIAHINEALRLLKTSVSTTGALSAGTAVAGVTVTFSSASALPNNVTSFAECDTKFNNVLGSVNTNSSAFANAVNTSVQTLATSTNTRIARIEAKLNALIAALSS